MAVKAHFGNPMIEQRNLAAGKAVVELDKVVLKVSGADALPWLHAMFTADFKNLKAGESREALWLDVQGHVKHEFHAFYDGSAVWLLLRKADVDAVVRALNMHIFREKVDAIENLDGQFAVFGAFGESGSALAGAAISWRDPWPSIVPGGARYAAEVPSWWNFTEHVVPLSDAASFAPGFDRVGTDALEALRIEAHRPSINDVDEKTLPHELDWLATAVHMSKGCYRGQEAVAKTHNLGHPPRRLTFLHLDGTGHDIPLVGDEIFENQDGKPGERAVGRITSVGQHYEAGPIALALLKRSLNPDAELLVISEHGEYSAKQEIIVPVDAGKAAGLKRPNLLIGK
jgi:folate-binding protein YgfZ